MTHNDFIKIYDDVVDKSICNDIISIFEEHPAQQKDVDNDARPKFTELNFTSNTEHFGAKAVGIHSLILESLIEKKKEYFDEIYSKAADDTPLVPDKHGWEQFRVKRYFAGDEQFKEHVDVGDAVSAKRYLAFILYLNQGFEGGHTEFPSSGLTITPRTGRLVIFPPLWTHPHAGKQITNPPEGKKYILSTYLNYL